MPAKPTPLPETQAELLAAFGGRLRQARLQRGLSAETVAAGAGITRVTLHRLERGTPAVTLGTAIKVLGVLGLEGDIARLAPAASAAQRQPRLIRIDRYPQLEQIAWHLAPAVQALTHEEAFSLYERHWRHVDRSAMGPRERALLKRLTATVGKGVLLV